MVAPEPPLEPTVEERQKQMVRGTWEDNYQGTHRILTIREDGTALMVVELDGIAALLTAPRMEFDIDWTVANNIVTLHTNGGRPEKKTRAILNIKGDHASYHLDKLEDNRLVLRDTVTKREFEWKRMSEEAIAKLNTPTTETE